MGIGLSGPFLSRWATTAGISVITVDGKEYQLLSPLGAGFQAFEAGFGALIRFNMLTACCVCRMLLQ
jgi:hypothetical protein